MPRLLDHPAVHFLFDRIDRANRVVRTDELAKLAESVCPLPPPLLLLQGLMASGYLVSDAPTLTPEAALRLTEAAAQHLEELRAAEQAARGGHLCERTASVVPPPLSDDDIMAFFYAVERGDVTLTRGRRALRRGETGLLRYTASNGWRLQVYVDGGRWGHLESVLRDDHRHFASFETLRSGMPRAAAYAPSDETARRVYGIDPGDMAPSKKRWKGGERDVNKARPFEFVLDVLAGRRRVTPEGGSSKVMRFFFDMQADAILTHEAIVTHFGVRRPQPFRYFAYLAPALVSEIMKRAGLDKVQSPLVIGLPPGEVRAPGFMRWSYKATLVWLVPAPDHLVLKTRKSPEAWAKPYVAPLPDEGPFCLPTLPEWQKPPVLYRSFDSPQACPRCGAASARFRDLDDALVCAGCGRSFKAAELRAPAG